MAASKLLIVAIVAFLVLVGAAADAGIEGIPESTEAAADSSLRLELEQLRSKISVLESSISDRIRELKSKDESVVHLGEIIQEKSSSIALLQGEIESLQKKGAVDAEEHVGKTHARAGELEKQVEKLKKEVETQNRNRDALETRAREAENKLHELNSKLESFQSTNEEQKHRIRKTERALKVAEEELMRAQLEATSKTEELTEIHGAWIPSWLTDHINYCQDLAATHWSEHARPALNAFLQKAYEKSTQARDWFEPHIETTKTKWVPAVKEQWMIFTTNAKPYVKMVSEKTIEFYEASKSTLSPHIARVQDLADPYFQEVKDFSELYINRVAIVTKPHIDKVRVSLKPYTKHVVRAYRKFLKSTTKYHLQAQVSVMEKLKKHELTKPLATKELAWIMASALLAFPIFFLSRIISAIFCKKTKKQTRNANANHASRRHKRRHAEK